jgi:hypothetical protein
MIYRHGGDVSMDLIEPAAEQNETLLKALTYVWAFDDPARPRIERILEQPSLSR